MLSARTHNEFGTWGIPGRKPVIVYGMALIGRLAAEAGTAGSNPIGGVLFGTANDHDIRITAYRPVECELSDEDGSPFSEAGEAELGRLAESWAGDPELAELEPVGFYRSRWESSIQLNQEDLRIWNRYFPRPSQVSLVLRVQRDSPIRAGFFFRPQHGGPVRIDSSYRTFEIEPMTEDVGRLAEAVRSGGIDAETPSSALPEAEESPAPPPELFTPPEPSRNVSTYLWGAAVLAAAMALLFVLISWMQSGTGQPAPMDRIGLRFSGSPDQLLLIWDPQSPGVRAAKRIELRVVDGESDTTELIAGPELRLGVRPLSNLSGSIEAQMRIYPSAAGGKVTLAAAQFVGPPAAAVVRTPEPSGNPPAERSERDKLQAALGEQARANGFLAQRIRYLQELQHTRPAPAAGESNPPLATPVTQTPKNDPPPTVAPQQQPVATAPQPAVVSDPGPNFGGDRAPSRASAPPPPPSAPAYNGPTSGKFIWTGYLAPGRTVTVDGRRASSGNVNGSLPGVPVRVSAYPGEFSSSGLTVYSAAPRHQAETVTEGRSAQNGWLNTRYVYDPARARDAQIAAGPTEAGGYQQVQITGGERPVSVVVVEWTVIR